jgi:hypothetical protein
MSDRRVPGVTFLDVCVPDDWTRFEVEVRKIPPSINRKELKHWRGFREHKKAWEEEIGQMLMVNKAPIGQTRAIAGAILRFPSRANRRDSGNFAGVVEKALGDALVPRVIPDDRAENFCFLGVEFDDEIGPERTTIVVFTHKEEG